MHRTFRNSEKAEEYTVFSTPECEFVNAVPYFAKLFRSKVVDMDLSVFRIRGLTPPPHVIKRINSRALDFWQEQFQAAINYKLDDATEQLYTWTNKKNQEKLASEITFNSDSLFAFMIQASDNRGYKYSRYISDYNPKELLDKKFPNFIYRESKDTYITQGEMNLKLGELKVAIEKRRRVIAEFLDDGENWHCFFRTLSGIYGKEEPHIDQPHLHYLSSNWNIPRGQVVNQLKSYRYKLPSIFIPFINEN